MTLNESIVEDAALEWFEETGLMVFLNLFEILHDLNN
jgi:hypothetical protein